jgi:hypothetical protein
VDGEPRAAGVNGFLMPPGAPELLRKLCKRNRRRVLLDPASKVFDPRVVGHPA